MIRMTNFMLCVFAFLAANIYTAAKYAEKDRGDNWMNAWSAAQRCVIS